MRMQEHDNNIFEMSKRQAERTNHGTRTDSIAGRSSSKPAVKIFEQKRSEVEEDKIKEERESDKKKISELQDEISRLEQDLRKIQRESTDECKRLKAERDSAREELEDKVSKLEESKRETTALKDEVSRLEGDLRKVNVEFSDDRKSKNRIEEERERFKSKVSSLENEVKRLREELEKANKDLSEKDSSKQSIEKEFKELKATYVKYVHESEERMAPATKEDIQCFIKEIHQQHCQTILDVMTKNERLSRERCDLEECLATKKHDHAKLSEEHQVLQQQWLAQSQQKQQKKCQQPAEECKRIFKEHEKMCSVLNSDECQIQRCVQMAQRVKDLEQHVEGQAAQFKKLSLMKYMAQQHDTEHDKLNMEYEELWTNPDIILEQLEEQFEDPFDAKVFLSHIFMDAYERSQNKLKGYLHEMMDDLYKVQPEDRKGELEALSRAYGPLLHASEAKTLTTRSDRVGQIREKVKTTLESIPLFKKAKVDLRNVHLPLDKVVRVAWKFVTQASPIIVCQPKKFNDEIHNTIHSHWDENHDDSKPLTYAQPVVYRSYHGIVLNKGLVGNK